MALKSRSLVGVLLVVPLLIMGGWWIARRVPDRRLRPDPPRPSPTDELLSQATEYLEAEHFSEAKQLALEVIRQSPSDGRALLLAGLSTAKQGDFADAIGYFDEIPRGSESFLLGLSFKADLLLYNLGRPSAAEQIYREVLEQKPDDLFVVGHFANLLCFHGRNWEAEPLLLRLLKERRIDYDQLHWLGVLDAVVDNAALLEMGRRASPDDALPMIGLARLALRDNELEKAQRLLEKAIAQAPDQIEGQARFGQTLLALSEDEAILKWHQQLPNSAEQHPEIWFVRGQWARERGETRVAVRCFAESFQRDPNHQPAGSQLAQVLAVIGERGLAEAVAERVRLLADLARELELLKYHRQQTERYEHVTDTMEKLGRHWEAVAWSSLALTLDPELKWARARIDRLSPTLSMETPLVISGQLPLRAFNFDEYPLPDWSSFKSIERLQVDAPKSHLHFADVAEQVGLKFSYVSGRPHGSSAPRIHETFGGGVAVMDYDADGWPDLYFTQAGDLAAGQKPSHQIDRLFRNQQGDSFDDVTENTYLDESGYTFGATVGDYNNDGFADLFVANAGRNGLYENMGDGTFREVAGQSGMRGEQWTCGGAVADFNGDGSPDIYALNYLAAADIYERVCVAEKNQERLCSPREFDAAQDRFYLSAGDGVFVDRTREAGLLVEHGKGLGLLVADFDHSGKLGIFVANDTTPNSFFVNHTTSAGAEPTFTDNATLAGLAFDKDGRTQACMGVAAGDANGDGLLDLFVTNFYLESNALYLQGPGLMFVDNTDRAGLRDASFSLLGFGTQFIDGELDGWRDLVLTNGHIDDRSDLGEPYRMRPQYYRNQGSGRFAELTDDTLGEYFKTEVLGRGMARLDWNRDGLEDFAVSHLERPAALISNQTTDPGRYLAVQLRGTESSRDAIGTTVWVTVGGRKWMQQLTGGDGYQASNEHRLVFGIADNARVDVLTVRWPSGVESSWQDLPTNSEWLLVEAAEHPLRLRNAGRITSANPW